VGTDVDNASRKGQLVVEEGEESLTVAEQFYALAA
jgi:hypothetical protein